MNGGESMKLPQIQIRTQMAKIGIKQIPGVQEIKQPKANLTIKQPKADLQMEATPSKLTIDQTKAWEDMDLMNILRRTEKHAEAGYEGWLEGMGRRAEQGQELMKIEHQGNPIANQAIINSGEVKKQLGITFIPSVFSVRTGYEPGEVHVSSQANKPIIHAEISSPEHHYKPGRVDISMEQYENIEFGVTYV